MRIINRLELVNKLTGIGTKLARAQFMIRISTLQGPDGTVAVIDGELSAADLPELRHVRASLCGQVWLQLDGLIECCEEGVQELRDWLASGARVRTATMFLRMVLETGPEQI